MILRLADKCGYAQGEVAIRSLSMLAPLSPISIRIGNTGRGAEKQQNAIECDERMREGNDSLSLCCLL